MVGLERKRYHIELRHDVFLQTRDCDLWASCCFQLMALKCEGTAFYLVLVNTFSPSTFFFFLIWELVVQDHHHLWAAQSQETISRVFYRGRGEGEEGGGDPTPGVWVLAQHRLRTEGKDEY